MKKSTSLFVSLIVLISLFSCKKEKEDNGVPTILKGHVSDTIRGNSIAGYKIVLIKKVGQTCANWECLTDFEDVATAYTDEDGDYSITFNYKLNSGQEYYYSEEYYGIPYFHESSSGSGPILPGKTNVLNVFAWKPVELIVNVEVLNNNNELSIACRFNNDKTLNATEHINEKNTKKTYTLRTRPNSDVTMHFWYFTGASYAPVLHDKVEPVRTTLNDVTTLDFIVDCSTF
jgi:hypothetical protein